MKKLSIFLSVIFSIFIGFSFAANPSIINHSYTIDGDDVRIFWTDNSNGGTVDINIQDPSTLDWMHFGTVDISDQVFTYTRQRDGDQKIWLIPDDGGDEVQFTIEGTMTPNPAATRTVIPAVPKTGPDVNIIGLIIATFTIFGGYIYIKRKADI